jgi:hypothetical protein
MKKSVSYGNVFQSTPSLKASADKIILNGNNTEQQQKNFLSRKKNSVDSVIYPVRIAESR